MKLGDWKMWLLSLALKALPFLYDYFSKLVDYAVEEIGYDIKEIVLAVEQANVGEDKWKIVLRQATHLFPETALDVINRAIEIALFQIKAEGKEKKK